MPRLRNWKNSFRRKRGQAVLLVTVALAPMVALVGLVVDLGYMYYLKNAAQAAADSAVLAAVYSFNTSSTISAVTCGSPAWTCNKTPTQCASDLTTAANPVETACLYAKQNGFSPANSGQHVTVVSDITPTIPTAPG